MATWQEVAVDIVVPVSTTLLLGFGGIALALMQKKLGLQTQQNALLLDANMRDKLQATLVTAVGMYVTGQKDRALLYVANEAGDAMAHLNVTPNQVATLVVNKAAAWAGVETPIAPHV